MKEGAGQPARASSFVRDGQPPEFVDGGATKPASFKKKL